MKFFYPFITVHYPTLYSRTEVVDILKGVVQEKIERYTKWGNPVYVKPYKGKIHLEGFEIERVTNGKTVAPTILGEIVGVDGKIFVQVKYKLPVLYIVWTIFVLGVIITFGVFEDFHSNLILAFLMLAYSVLRFNLECNKSHRFFKELMKATPSSKH